MNENISFAWIISVLVAPLGAGRGGWWVMAIPPLQQAVQLHHSQLQISNFFCNHDGYPFGRINGQRPYGDYIGFCIMFYSKSSPPPVILVLLSNTAKTWQSFHRIAEPTLLWYKFLLNNLGNHFLQTAPGCQTSALNRRKNTFVQSCG